MGRSRSGRMAMLLAVCGAGLLAQGTQTSDIAGSLVDTQEVPVPRAIVRVTSPSLQGERSVATDAKGRFVLRLLPPGDYLIEITKPDHETVRLRQHLGLDQVFQPRVRISRLDASRVEVVAAPPAVDKTGVQTASNYRMDRMDLLPVRRTMENLALLTPGVAPGIDGGVQVRGAMTSSNLILVDGQNVEDGAYGDRGVSLIEEAIEETQVITGALSAEYGGVDGGVINTITRSGSNTYSGQVRWNAQNPAWNALRPLTDRNGIDNRTGLDTTVSLGGYLVQDRLWFHTAYFKEALREARSISGDAFRDPAWPGGAGATYTYGRDELRRQLKLTWLASAEHTLELSYLNSGTAHQQRDYYAGSLDTLAPQRNDDEVLHLAWRTSWSPRVISDIRYGFKKQWFRTGLAGNSGQIETSPLWNMDDGYFYNRGPFNGDDGGDHRDNQTYSGKTSVLLEGGGTHQVDAGFDGYRSVRRARAELSPTGYLFSVREIDPVARTAVPVSVSVYTSRAGEAVVRNQAMYLNDKWVLNDQWAFQAGVRWERFEGRDESGAKLAGSEALSPRLGLKVDLYGDSRWIAGLSYARYNAKLLDQLLLKGTFQDNPQVLDFNALDGTAPVPFSQIFDLAGYDFSAGGVSYANLPGVNIRVNPRMKAPAVDELQASLAYSFKDTPIGSGYLRGTAVRKDWKNLIDYRVGNQGRGSFVIPQSGEVLQPYLYAWDNNPDAKRTYHALELEFSTAKRPWQLQGNLTWSSLWGNYEGQDAFTPGKGEGMHAWDVTDGVAMFDSRMTAPEGYLRGHVPWRARLMGTYTLDSAFGTTTFGAMYRYDAGSREDETRSISGEALNPALPAEARNAWFTQYKDNRRGSLEGHSSWYLDVSVNHEWTLGTIKRTPVKAFFKAVILNVLNHQQLLRTPRRYEAATVSASEPWVPADGDGVPGPDCYGEPRSTWFSAGARF